MSARNRTFPYSLLGRLARGAVPVDGVVWFDPRAAEEASPQRTQASSAACSRDEDETGVHCLPAQIF